MDKSKTSQLIGRQIRGYRIYASMSQDKLAEMCGLHCTYIGQLERGEKNPTVETLVKITKAFNVSLSTCLKDIEEIGGSELNYPSAAYELVVEMPLEQQIKAVNILKVLAQ